MSWILDPIISLINYVPDVSQDSRPIPCAALQTLRLENTVITTATHIPGDKVLIKVPGSCSGAALVTASICRVHFIVNTTSTSRVHAEAWLPDEWYGRFLGVGNRGVGGCIDYDMIDYGSSLHFAAVGSDNGHDGNDDPSFAEPEVVNDFAFRAVHVEAVIGKQIVEAYYGRPHSKSYYLGCSTGGRQGIQAALRYPEDFDGILAGAPAVDWNHLMGWMVMLGIYIGAPNAATSPSVILFELWEVVAAEIMKQCDALDGVEDGIITEPDDCHFKPSVLLCSQDKTTDCLTEPQIAALEKIYQPLLGSKKELLYPRYDPGTAVMGGWLLYFRGDIMPMSDIWYKTVVLKDPNFDFSNFNLSTIALAEKVNPGGISTFDGDLSAFKKRGGKLITYHGRADTGIASGISKRYYNLVAETMGMRNLDSFYRLFLVPGMSHCMGGRGAAYFGQFGFETNAVNTTRGNILLALVDWVENGAAPDTIVGTAYDGTQRSHCRFPQKSVWDGEKFNCQV
ncbi:hypothetical protein D9615_009054 [Tricholomella constricta]|uniref:Carboxylic ester hydrolase n=1 Tax=Tricholomella constricta TaxID=117010 RepID=A0A8H5H143_9AGAR|nr:hypothetical protein D9615_009054 [Tricholomella constricta]